MTGLRPLLVINSLWQGGAEQSTTDTVLRLHRAGAHPRVICLRSGHMPLADDLRATGVSVTHLGEISHFRAVRAIRRAIREHRADLVHVTLFEATLLGTLAAIGTGVPVLASVVSTPQFLTLPTTGISGLKRRVIRAAEGLAYRGTSRVHAVSPGVAAALREIYGTAASPITVVERGRSPELFRPVTTAERTATRAGLGLEDEHDVVLSVGRHEHDKGYDLLVQAFDRLDRPNLVVLVAGRDGGASDEVRATIARARHPERFRLLGEREDVPQLLGAADIVALPSRREGAAGSVLEAMAVGVPVVTFEIDGLAGRFEDGINGRVVPPGDIVAFGEVAAELLDDPGRARSLADRARRSFLERYTLDRSAAGMVELYLAVASRPR